LLALGLALAVPAAAAPPSRAEIDRAVEAVRKHPDLSGTRTEKSLRFKQSKAEQRKQEEKEKEGEGGGQPFGWLRDVIRWIADAGRVFIWTLGAILVAMLAVGIWRWMQVRGGITRAARATLPSHVQSLDIRPESLPNTIGAAAAQLWQRGEQSAALSLLYRGALSRLVHGHGVRIRAASTEGECVSLARAALDAPRSSFFARLVGAWQLAVYGARLPSGEQALALCREFDTHWPAPAATTA
jgi:hypothetical protein